MFLLARRLILPPPLLSRVRLEIGADRSAEAESYNAEGYVYSWFRFYHEVVDDPKVQTLSPYQFRAWVNLLCIAAKHDGQLPDLRSISYRLHLTENRAKAMIDELVELRLFESVDGVIRPHKWQERQFNSRNPELSGSPVSGRYVYIAGPADSLKVKIGFSKNPWARVHELQTGSQEPLKILALFRSNSTSEADLHVLLSKFHVHREWFELPSDLLSAFVSVSRSLTYEELLEKLRSDYDSLLRSATLRITTNTDTDTDTEQKHPIVPLGDFEEFWKIYPQKRRKAKQAALKAWKRIKPTKDTCAAIYAAIEAQKFSEDWQKDNGQFIPYPATWLNQGRWEDEIDKPLSFEEREKLGQEHWKTVKANR